MRRFASSEPAINQLLGSAWSRFAHLVDQAQDRARAFYQQRLGQPFSIEGAVQHILDSVEAQGDTAIERFNRLFDGIELPVAQLRFGAADCRAAFESLESPLQIALEQAAERIRAYQRRLLPQSFGTALDEPLGVRWLPLDRVCGYVPGGAGGKLPLCSSVLMNLMPARVAGVRELALFTPARADGSIHPAVLGAAHLVDCDEVWGIGGVQAIAAAAHGTSSIRAVDKIVGPGNLFVTLAKRAVFGRVDIDMLAGPSEVLVIADGSVDPAWAAADLLSQAEHDAVAVPALVALGDEVADAIHAEVMRQLAALPEERRHTAERSVADMGWIVVCQNRAEAVNIANRMAAEHLELLVANPQDWLPELRHAGAIFVGPWSPEPIGDYVAGPSHTLPTGGTARMWSGIGADTFLRRSSIINFSAEDFQACAQAGETLAAAEGLEAHRRSIAIRRGATGDGG
ncbi:MAG: histidinol dehydrogenase [Planctomycetota bacterium]|nr:MAG: histidinol dehydrogenase [Planctomycetota bacterium]